MMSEMIPEDGGKRNFRTMNEGQKKGEASTVIKVVKLETGDKINKIYEVEVASVDWP